MLDAYHTAHISPGGDRFGAVSVAVDLVGCQQHEGMCLRHLELTRFAKARTWQFSTEQRSQQALPCNCYTLPASDRVLCGRARRRDSQVTAVVRKNDAGYTSLAETVVEADASWRESRAALRIAQAQARTIKQRSSRFLGAAVAAPICRLRLYSYLGSNMNSYRRQG